MSDLLRDLRHSLRMFRQTPGFTLAALSALMLGIGANTAIFSVVNTVLLKPLPFPEPQRLVNFMNVGPNGSNPGASVPKFNLWREQTNVVQDAAAYSFGVMNLTGGDNPEQLPSARVTPDFFKLFGAQTIAGRTFTADMVMAQGMTLALIGVAIGFGAALALSKLIESVLFGVTAKDPMVFVAVPAVLASVALIAVWLPALRATRIDPIDALRCE
jgi:hypothetical protein